MALKSGYPATVSLMLSLQAGLHCAAEMPASCSWPVTVWLAGGEGAGLGESVWRWKMESFLNSVGTLHIAVVMCLVGRV